MQKEKVIMSLERIIMSFFKHSQERHTFPPIASQPKTLGFDRTISNFQMVFHIKAFLGKCIIWCMDMGAHDKPEFTGAVKLKIKS